jgi:hypothetical protein
MKLLLLAPLAAFFGVSTLDGQSADSKNKKEAFVMNTSVDNESYVFSAVVNISNGKGEDVPVAFNAIAPKQVWDNLKKWNGNDSVYFSFIASQLSISAEFSLINHLSFEPFSKQFFGYSEGRFICVYGLMGRNGYGNMIETTVDVTFDPSKKMPLPSTVGNADSIKPPKLNIIKNRR